MSLCLWSFSISLRSADLVNLTTRFTDELMSHGLTKQILNLVSEVSVTREFEKLQKERGLGNEKHRKEVRSLMSFLTLCQMLMNYYISFPNDAVFLIKEVIEGYYH